MHPASVSDQPISSSMSRSTPQVIGSLSTSTPSQSNRIASNFIAKTRHLTLDNCQNHS